MKAKYEGSCPLCGRPIHVGDEVTRWHGRWVHATCVEDPVEVFLDAVREGRIYVSSRALKVTEKDGVRFPYAEGGVRDLLKTLDEKDLERVRKAAREVTE